MRNLLFFFALSLFACSHSPKSPASLADRPLPSPNWPAPPQTSFRLDSALSPEILHDKILGALVGSAIGDALGGPTEMWGRGYIESQFGFVDTLDALIRDGSPEGPWEDNMPGGSTTDDTRWKYLTGTFLLKHGRTDSLDPHAFAQHITDAYQADLKKARETTDFAPEEIERELQRVAWLQEWAKVARAYNSGSPDAYAYAMHKFYGGEMTCAGMLYAPLLGAFFPATPEKAYLETYRLGLFDLGYARDITGLTAALVSAAMKPGAQIEKIPYEVCAGVDPLRYFNSRLGGRIAFRFWADAKYIVAQAKKLTEADIPKDLRLPAHFKGSRLEWFQISRAYELMEPKLQDQPLHGAEIHFINLAALEFGGGDFRKTLTFVINFGRDNDTVGAVTGAILGAYLGFEKLPKDWVKQVLASNSNIVGIPLEQLARELTAARLGLK